MGLFSFFSKPLLPAAEPIINENDDVERKPEIRPEVFVDNSDPEEKQNSTSLLTYGTNMPIDAIYRFISRDYEQDGYEDAMCNADSSYKDSKKSIIKNELRRLFEQVKLRYKGDLRDIEVQIRVIEQQGLINTAASLKARKETYEEHMEVLRNMELALDREEEQMLSMIASYDRGFLKGLAARTNIYLNNGQTQ